MPATKLTNLENEIITSVKETFKLPKESSVEVDDESLKNAGFCSTLKTVCLDGRYNVVLKCAPTGQKLREVIPFETIFQREIYVYEIVFPIFKEIQQEHNVEELWESFPKCWCTSKEALVLENLKTQGFTLWSRSKEMDDGHMRLVLEEYAKFHALSFALRAHKAEVLKQIEDNTEDVYLPIIKKCGTTETIRNLSERVWKDSFGESPSFDVVEVMEQLVAKGAAGKYGVLCHGDTWCNNILFKYKNSGLHPAALKLLDFQLARFGSPVLDLSYFLYSSASLSNLKNLDEFLKHYHDTLTTFLKQFHCDSSSLFPYEALEEHWRRFAKFGLGMAFLVVNVMMMDDNELPDVNDNNNGEGFVGSFEKQSKNDRRYLERMVGILRHFKERGLL